MSDGLVAVYTLLEDLPVDGEIYVCSHTINKTVFGLKDSDPRQRPYPIRTMALVSGGSQVSRKSTSRHRRIHYRSRIWAASQVKLTSFI